MPLMAMVYDPPLGSLRFKGFVRSSIVNLTGLTTGRGLTARSLKKFPKTRELQTVGSAGSVPEKRLHHLLGAITSIT